MGLAEENINSSQVPSKYLIQQQTNRTGSVINTDYNQTTQLSSCSAGKWKFTDFTDLICQCQVDTDLVPTTDY